MPFFSAPRTVHTPDDVLELAQALVDSDSLQVQADDAREISCKAGCSACCSQAVPVTAAELRSIANYITQMPAEREEDLTQRVSQTATDLAAAGFSADTVPAAGPTRSRYSLNYFRQQQPCPLLDSDGTCGVRPVRPLACRDYLVSSDPVHCRSLDVDRVTRVGSERDVVTGFRRVSAHFGEPDTNVLALSLPGLLNSPSTAPQGSSPTPGTTIVHLLTSERRAR